MGNQTGMIQKSNYPKIRRYIVTVVIIALAITAIIMAYSIWRSFQPFSTPLFQRRVLLNGTITVGPYYYYIQFSVPSDASSSSIQVTGNFSVVKGDTIRVYIMNETCLSHFWDVDSNLSPNYDSGQVASGDIDVLLPQGDMYYLIYYKDFGYDEKIVTTQVLLEYWYI